MKLDLPFVAALKERLFARGVVKRLLRSHSAVCAALPELSREERYREALRRSGLVAPSRIDELMHLATDSVDAWTAPGRHELGLRELAHFLVVSKHVERGHAGSVVSFGAIVSSMIPPHL